MPVGERLYRAEGPELIAFGAGGAHLATGADVTAAWERVWWRQDTTLHLRIALAGVVALLSTLPWPVATCCAGAGRRRAPRGSPGGSPG